MTEKRFTLKYIEEQYLSANLYDDKTFIGSIGIGEELITELLNQLNEENEQLKKVLGAILLEVKQDITITNKTGEIKVFINPNSFELISEVLKKYGALKEWYE